MSDKESTKLSVPSLEEDKQPLTNEEIKSVVNNLQLDAPSTPTKMKEGKEICSDCKKTREEIEKDGDQLKSDVAGTLKCLSCVKKEKIKMLQGVKKSDTKKPPKALLKRVENTEKKIEGFNKRYIDPAQLPPESSKAAASPPTSRSEEILNEAVGQDISQIIKSYRDDLIENVSSVEKDLRQYFTDKEVSTLKRAVDLPPLTNFLYMVFRFLKKQISLDHPLTSAWSLDINNNKDVLRNRFINRFLPLFKFAFYVKNSELLEYFLVSAIIVACDLEHMIKEAKNYWDRRSERWVVTVQAFLVEFLTRDNTFFNTWEMISNSPIEMQKLFSGFISNLSKLASIERRITKDTSTQFDRAFQSLEEQQKAKKIVENFDTKYLVFVDQDDKLEILKILLNDNDLKVKPEEVIALISRLSNDARKKFINQLRPSLMPDEIDTLVPELAKYRGRVYTT
jgi:hypothetical protein